MDHTVRFERVTLTLPEPLVTRIDAQRDLAPRSPYIRRLLEKALAAEPQPSTPRHERQRAA
jgi:hypothetical protein